MELHKSRNKEHKFCPHCGSVMERYLTVEEAAQITSMSIEFWRTKVRTREIEYVKIGRCVRIPYTSIMSFIQRVPAINTQTIYNQEVT